MSYELVINSTQDEVVTALLHENKLIELHKEGLDDRFNVGDVYLGKVKKIVPSLNAAFVDDMSSGSMAALLTLMGSYMGTQAQSVGLGRIYGGFSRADRLVITMIGLLAASIQAITDTAGISSNSIHEYFDWIILGNSELNGITFAIAFSAWGGVYTFIIRFLKTRKGLLG